MDIFQALLFSLALLDEYIQIYHVHIFLSYKILLRDKTNLY